jgi:hypothetical protein
MTSTSGNLRAGRALALGAAALVLLGGCLDGPFAHANPYDPENPMTLSIEGGRDTIVVAGEAVQFHLVTDPIHTFPSPSWTSSAPSLLLSLGAGRFIVPVSPLETTVVQVSAVLGSKEASRAITILAAAP